MLTAETEIFTFKVETGTRPFLSNAKSKANHYTRAKQVKLWRHASLIALTQMKAPKGFEQVGYAFRAFYPHKPIPDTSNIHPTAKAIVDGSVDWGVIPDDTPDHNLAELYLSPRFGKWIKTPYVLVGVYDMSDTASVDTEPVVGS